MAIVDLRSLLKQAKEGNFAVGSFNVFNFETLSAVVSVAEEMKVPVVIGLSERLFRFADVDGLAVAMVRTAYRSSAPIAVQLDHGRTYEGIIRAIRWGFNAVMYDGSHLSTDENIKRTREIARLARAAGVALEAELDCQHLITPSGGGNIS
ncbi:MAG: class II fructose-bisphosphate aldolase, partial [Negativicutes bacterium]|nr:class II fructose-bisphosphate aldolase [Negativicutes bacterium]